jgi:NAD(P)-dependent dehydrogenase (short-subunit alcohol dehydrogenase family)
MSDFAGLVAIVTGGASGIGAATADILLDRGARVAVLDRTPIDDARFLTVACDVTDDATVTESVATVVKELGGVDILINNAGIGAVGGGGGAGPRR